MYIYLSVRLCPLFIYLSVYLSKYLSIIYLSFNLLSIYPYFVHLLFTYHNLCFSLPILFNASNSLPQNNNNNNNNKNNNNKNKLTNNNNKQEKKHYQQIKISSQLFRFSKLSDPLTIMTVYCFSPTVPPSSFSSIFFLPHAWLFPFTFIERLKSSVLKHSDLRFFSRSIFATYDRR